MADAWVPAVTPYNPTTGVKILNDDLAGIIFPGDTTQVGQWQSYTPVLRGSVTDPTLGAAATAVGQYMRVGKALTLQFRVNVGGAGFVNGAGNVNLDLPVSMDAGLPGASQALGVGYYGDTSAVTYFSVVPTPTGANAARCAFRLLAVAGTQILTYAAPAAWAVNDEISGTFTYLPA